MSQCDCSDAQPLMPLETALAQLLAERPPMPGGECVPLSQGTGRILAQDQFARFDVPAWDNSAMDGYALCATDLGTTGGYLPMHGRVVAGNPATVLPPGTAMRIFTGAPLPIGADTVMAQEDCHLEGNQVLLPAPLRGRHVRLKGEELRRGDPLLGKGHRLRAQDIGLLASQGMQQIPVYKRLRVAILSSGDELREPGQRLTGGQIYDANRYTLQALLQGWGIEAIDAGCMADDLVATRERLAELAQTADVLISSGGVSVGEEDHLKQAVRELGTLQLWRLAIQPGKPLAFGRVAGKPWMGLPGNPVAVLVTALMVARPWLMQAQGLLHDSISADRIPADFHWQVARPRRQFLRAKKVVDDAGEKIKLLANQGSAMLSTACWADGLVEIEPHRTFAQGELVRYWSFTQLLN
ncbi:molybdopterin molybdotransferase MoeA [Halopseudomonas salegens]|uniref:Molybdopterin molybdenumtransferase n=1 Tax=Halopseudomonas salegens TaxID=1434072 RepID=A0A1H2F7S0_9GAMM|nr:gephyrin-like molybdotransferase Glp [Halopseudomonas salegens]SDU03372.1 molybdopterin molybdochelatase [Halopseudomonas salegens]